jgi:hypothetical protein
MYHHTKNAYTILIGKLNGQRLLGDLIVDGRVKWKNTGFKVSAAVLLSIQVVWDVTPCGWVSVSECFEETWCHRNVENLPTT